MLEIGLAIGIAAGILLTLLALAGLYAMRGGMRGTGGAAPTANQTTASGTSADE